MSSIINQANENQFIYNLLLSGVKE